VRRARPPARRLAPLVLLAIAVSVLGCECRQRRGLGKIHLNKLTPDWRKGRIAIPDDGSDAAFVARWPEGEQVVTHEAKGPFYAQAILPDYSPRTRRLFYWALNSSGADDQLLLVADGVPVATGFEQNGIVTYSQDGTRWAAITSSAEKFAIVLVDGAIVGRHQAVSVPAFSADGKHVAYIYREGPGRTALVVDGTKRSVYEATPGGCGVVDESGSRLDPNFVVRYLADGRLLVVTQEQVGWTVTLDGERLATYEASSGGAATGAAIGPTCGNVSRCYTGGRLSLDTPVVAVWWERLAGPAERWRVVRNGKSVDEETCGGYWESQSPVLSRDGAHVAYACPTMGGPSEAGVHVIFDGKRYGPYDDVWGIEMAPSGEHFAYGAATGGPIEQPWRLYRDGEPISPPEHLIWRPHFDESGKHLAWQRRRSEKARGRLGIDDRIVGTFDDLIRGPEYNGNTVWWAIRHRKRILRVEVPLS
jgi:hypothetical protein